MFLCLMVAVLLGVTSTPSARSETTTTTVVAAATLEQAATYFALGSYDAAEDEIRRFISAHPSDADKGRRDDAIKLLTEVRIEKERERLAVSASSGHSGATANVESDRSTATASPRVVDPSILSSPTAQVPLKWERAFPGAPDKFRKDGIYAVTASGEGSRTVMKLYYSGSAEVAQQRTGTTLTIDIMGLTDALPKGGLDFPAGGALRLRHNQRSTEPLVTRVVIDLKTTDATATVTSGNEEIVIEITQSAASASMSTEGGLYRSPVASDRYKIDIIGGNFQRTMVGDALPEVMAVKVTDVSSGAAVADVAVDFITVDAGVQCSPTSAKTSADGVVSSRINLSQIAGRKVVVARIPGGPAEVSFEAYGLPRPPDSLRKVSGEDAKVRTRQVSATPLAVVVQDIYGNPIPGVVVEWEFIQGHGTLDADGDKLGNQSSVESDKDGRAVLRQWTTGPISGVQKIQASFTTGEVTKFVQFSVDVMPQLVSMDFFKTSVPEILRFLGRIADWNLIISSGIDKMPELDASVTVHFENVPIDEALDKILAMKNLTRIEQPDGSIKLMTFIEAQTSGQSVVTDAAELDNLPQDMVRTVILTGSPRSDFATMVAAVTPLLTPTGKIISDPASHKVVITDYVSVIRRVRDILAEFGKAEDQRILTFKNLNLQAPDLAAFVTGQIPPEVKTFFNGKTGIFLGPTSSIDRIEGILTAIDNSDAFAQGSGDKDKGKQFEIIPLRSQKAVELAGILNSVFTNQKTTQFITGVTTAAEQRAAATTTTTTTTGGTTATTRVAPANEGTNLLGKAFKQIQDEVRIVAEPRTNSLILYGLSDDLAIVKAVVTRLDSFDLAKEELTLERVKIVQVKYRTSTEVLQALLKIMGLDKAAATTDQANPNIYWWDAWYGGSYDRTSGTHVTSATGARVTSTMTETQPLPLQLVDIPDPNLIVIVGGDSKQRAVAEGLIEEIDKSINRKENYLQAYDLHFMLPTEFNKLLDKTLLNQTTTGTDMGYDPYLWWWTGLRPRTGGTSEVRRLPVDASRILLVWAKRDVHSQINQLLERLDTTSYTQNVNLVVKNYAVTNGDLQAVAQIMIRNTLNQSTDVTDEFLFVDSLNNQIVVWAHADAHLRIERLLPQIDRIELKFDPALKYDVYEFKNISVSEIIGVTTTSERQIVEQVTGFGGGGAAARTSQKTILELITEALGTAAGRGIYPSITGNFILVWGPTGDVDRSISFARQIDRRWENARVQVRTYTVRFGDAKTVANFINAAVFAPQNVASGGTAGGRGGGVSSIVTTEFLVPDPVDPRLLHIWALPATHDRIRTYMSVVDTTAFTFSNFKIFRVPGLSSMAAGNLIRGVAPTAQLFQIGDLWVIMADIGALQRVEEVVRAITRPDTEHVEIRYVRLSRVTVDDIGPILESRFGIAVNSAEFTGRAIFYINSPEELKSYEEFRSGQRSRAPLTILVMAKQNLLIMLGDSIYVNQAQGFVEDIENSTAGRPRLLTLKYIGPTAFATMAKEIYPNIRTFEIGRNDAIVVMEPDDTTKMDELKRMVDVSPASGSNMALYDIVLLKYRSADDVKAAVVSLLTGGGGGGGGGGSGGFSTGIQTGGGRSNTPLALYAVVDANALIITGGSDEERSLAKKIAVEMDSEPYRRDKYVQLYAFHYILPSEFEKFLTATLIDEKTIKKRYPAEGGEPAYSTVEVTSDPPVKRIAIDSLKLLMVVTTRPIHQQTAELIALIDTPGFATRLELRARNYAVKKANIDVIANIITRQTLNQVVGSADEFLIIDREKHELVIWAREGAHTKIERLLPVYDRAEIQFDPDDEFDSYVFQYVSLPIAEPGTQIVEQVRTILGPGRVIYSAGGQAGNFVLMWGNRAALSRAKETLRRFDMAVKDQVGGESNVRFVEVHNRPVSELIVELKGIWGLSTNLVPMSRAEGSPRNGIMIFVPLGMIGRIVKTIEDLDTVIPTRTFRSSYLHTTDMTTISTLFPDLKFITAGAGAGGGFEMMLVQGTQSRLDELARLWTTLDTPGRIVQYGPVNRAAAVLDASLHLFMVHIGSIITMGGAGAPEIITLYGDAPRVEEALAFLKQIDVAGDVKLLKYGRLPAADAAALVTAFYPGVLIRSLSNGSILAAAGNKEALAAVEKLLADIEGGLQWRIVPLTRMSATDASTLITSFFGPALRNTPLPANNVVVLLGNEVNLAEATEMIRKIDMREIRLFPVKNANLAEVAATVQAFYPQVVLTNLPAISTLSVAADSVVLEAIEKFIRGIDKSVHTAIRPLKHYDPTSPSELTDLTTTLRTYLSATGTLFFDRQSNSFVITDGLGKVEKALSVLDDLDRAPPQFIIEAVIAEVAITDNKNLGIAWASRPDLTDLGFLPSTPLTPPAAGGAGADFNGTFTLSLARNHLQATITALLSKNDARIVATPKIVTRNNIKGVVNIQQSFPVTTTTPGAVGVAPQTTVTFQQVPIILTVTPSSTWSSDDIRLTVNADISVAGAQTITGAVNVSSRIVNTTVDMKDGQTLIIGGLMNKSKSEAVSKIPFLGDIPGIGPLFRTSVASELNSEVLIFLSPRIVYPQQHDLEMEEELNRYKYLVNFPVDWSGRRWLMNNSQRNPGLRQQMNQPSNYILQPPPPAPAPMPVAPGSTTTTTMTTTTTPAPVSMVSTPYTSVTMTPAATTTTTRTTTMASTTPTYEPEPPSPQGILFGVTTTYNINTATAAELKTIPGMPAHVAQLIVAYRGANGFYRSLNDLLNVPGVTVELLESSRKYLRMATDLTPVAPTPVAANEPTMSSSPASAPAPAPTYIPSASPAPSSMRVNLNSADVDELKTLPGIADNVARMIIAYRNTYGTFQTTDQLIDVPGVTPEMYGRIRDMITVSSSSVPAAARPPTFTPVPVAAPQSSGVNINTATEAELATVPGFSTQNIKLIVAFRKKYGAFSTVDDLLNVPSITPEILDRVRDYLTTAETANARPAPAAPRAPPPAAPRAYLVNINTATEAELRAVPGLNEQNVNLIIAYRESYGPYKTVGDILEVPSITPEIYDRVKDRLTVN